MFDKKFSQKCGMLFVRSLKGEIQIVSVSERERGGFA